MRRDHDEPLDPRRPALIVLCGSARRRYRPLEGDVVILGRAPGCDVGLVSPEVAPVHCVLVRLPQGWRIRDCSGRPGTCVNGKVVQDEPLCDGDTVQVGTFSFRAHLPRRNTPVPAAPAADPRRARSRHNLARLALGLRRRLRERAEAEGSLARREADLEAQANELQRRRQELGHYARHLRALAGRLHAQAGTPPARPVLEAEADALRQELRGKRGLVEESCQRLDRLESVRRVLQERLSDGATTLAPNLSKGPRSRQLRNLKGAGPSK